MQLDPLKLFLSRPLFCAKPLAMGQTLIPGAAYKSMLNLYSTPAMCEQTAIKAERGSSGAKMQLELKRKRSSSVESAVSTFQVQSVQLTDASNPFRWVPFQRPPLEPDVAESGDRSHVYKRVIIPFSGQLRSSL